MCKVHAPGQCKVCLCALSLCRLFQQAACISQQPLLQPLPGLHQPLPLRVQQHRLLHPAGNKKGIETDGQVMTRGGRAAAVLRPDHN